MSAKGMGRKKKKKTEKKDKIRHENMCIGNGNKCKRGKLKK